ncbi:hypothetical protein D3C85_1853710 [compost metagenome]
MPDTNPVPLSSSTSIRVLVTMAVRMSGPPFQTLYGWEALFWFEMAILMSP